MIDYRIAQQQSGSRNIISKMSNYLVITSTRISWRISMAFVIKSIEFPAGRVHLHEKYSSLTTATFNPDKGAPRYHPRIFSATRNKVFSELL